MPPLYEIPAGSPENPQFLRVEDGQRPIRTDRGDHQYVTEPASIIAKSVVQDWAFAQPAQDSDAGPGIFWKDEVVTNESLKAKFAQDLAYYTKFQIDWWKRLVHLADDMWTRNHIFAQVSDLERIACRELGLKRDWLDDRPDSIIKCPVCTTLISVSSIVCFACHVVLKPEKLKEFQFLGGQPPVQSLNK